MATSLLATRKIDCKDLHGYLRTLPHSVLDRLYNHPTTCLAIFRELPELSKQYVMRLLFIEQPAPQAIVSFWVTDKHQQEHKQAISAISGLRVWHQQPVAGGQGWLLNPTFRHNMKIALLGGSQSGVGGGPLPPDPKHAKDIPFLEKYALERWECVLHFMVGSSEGTDGISSDTKDVLLQSGMMKCEANDPTFSITPSGFQFLLMDTPSQVWCFMLQYLETVESRGMDLVECLSFLFQLSFSTLGKDYSTEGMSESRLKFLQHLREFGLVYQRKRKAQRFYPTGLAINLASGMKESNIDTHRAGYIVVETNYRVYAYTDSPLCIALVALFSEMVYRFPNLAVGILSRQSVRAALYRGITAEQIINFLRSHAHPEMLKEKPAVPPTIIDQVRLWELERDRFKFTEGVLYNQFLSQADFELLRDYARDLGVLVWDQPKKRTMVVSRSGHDEVKRFWKRQKNANS